MSNPARSEAFYWRVRWQTLFGAEKSSDGGPYRSADIADGVARRVWQQLLDLGHWPHTLEVYPGKATEEELQLMELYKSTKACMP